MSDREVSPSDTTDERLVRAHLSELVDDVRPASGSLARVLARRRRRASLRPVLAGAGVAVAATAAVLAVVVPSPVPVASGPRPVGTSPDSYVSQVRRGVLARVDLESGRSVGEIARLPGRVTSVATDGAHVYAAVSGQRQRIYELTAGHVPKVIQTVRGAPITNLTATQGRIAYVSGDAAVVHGGGTTRTIRVPGRAVDLALTPNGHLVLLAAAEGTRRPALRVVAPGSATSSPVRTGRGCAPLAIASAETDVAALYRVDCRPGAPVRVATVDPETGERLSAGTRFDAGPGLERGEVNLSVGRLGRYLVSVPGSGQWLVDGSTVRAVPGVCRSGTGCLGAPSVL